MKSVSNKPYLIMRGNLYANPRTDGSFPYRRVIAELEDGYLTIGTYGVDAMEVQFFGKEVVAVGIGDTE